MNVELLDEGEVSVEAVEDSEESNRAEAKATMDAYEPRLPPEAAQEGKKYRLIGLGESYSPPEAATLEQMRVEDTGGRLDKIRSPIIQP